MQIFVIGMHRSGTSMTCRLVNMMGAYFGPEGCQWDPNDQNPRGFWERKDYRQLNDDLLAHYGCTWQDVDQWPDDFSPSTAPSELVDRARKLIFRMEGFRPWVTKEPRFCLTFPIFKQHCEMPVVINVIRHPSEVAISLSKHHDIPVDAGVRIWQQYTKSQLEVTVDCPRIVVRHESLINNPESVTRSMFGRLCELGVRRIQMPSSGEIRAFVSPKLYRSRSTESVVPESIKNLYETALGSATV